MPHDMRPSLNAWLTGFVIASLTAVYWHTLPERSAIAAMAGLSVVLSIKQIQLVFISLPALSEKSFLFHRDNLTALHFTLAVKMVAGALAGIVWMASVGHWHTALQLPASLFNRTVMISGAVADSTCKAKGASLLVNTDVIGSHTFTVSRNIMLYSEPQSGCYWPGQRVVATVKLHQPYSFQNPGGYDQEKMWLSKQVHALGRATEIAITKPASGIRTRLKHFVESSGLLTARWLNAVVIGDRAGLYDADWALLQHTGTAHLFTVSGLHLGIVAGWVLFAGRWVLTGLASFTRLRHSGGIHIVLAVFTGAGCLAYAVVAGGALPVVRACILLIIGLVLINGQRFVAVRGLLLVMVTLCIITFPFALFGVSFYLSIGAVLLIFYLLSLRSLAAATWSSRCLQVVRLQIMLSLFMLPVSIVAFGVFSPSSVPANLVAIPLVTLLVPVGLLTLMMYFVSQPAAQWLLSCCDWLMGLILDVLTLLASLLAVHPVALSPALLLLPLMTCLLMLWLPPFAFKRLSIVIGVAAIMTTGIPANSRDWYVHVFDVGQGTAIAVTRGGEAIIIDTGPSYEGGSRFEKIVDTVSNLVDLNLIRI